MKPRKSAGLPARLLRPDSLPLLLIDFVIVFALGYAASAFFGSAEPAAAGANTQTAQHDHEADAGPTLWTCSMHPQIKKNKPGKCPICGMELIPLTSNTNKMTGLRQLVVSPEARALMNIQVAPVERRYVEAKVRMVGKVDYDETRLKHITAWVPGRLDRLFVDYTGVQVTEGEHMVYIYSEELYAAQQELIEAVRTKRERGDKPDNSFFNTGGVDLLESAREKLRLLGLTKQQIAEIEARDKPTDHVMIYSPMSGIVIRKLKQEGDRVNVGERIYTVADLSHLWIRLDAYESDLMWVRYGQRVGFTTEAYPGQQFIGRVAFIDPVLDDRTRTVKVRVNIPNPDGKLKPEMFVHGVVSARVAAGGRVVDTELQGKWISPMHPEIVRDQPGICDICGMPLVPAESLGYVSADAAGLSRPLVIPVSAALVTGTRAIVYVEDPKAKEPTFEGREIVLGPRAGDYYLVRTGLEEGELVVTRGNFRIDSSLQIVARPSMMTPEGGGGGGHHHHGGDESKKKPAAAGSKPAPMVTDLPISVRQRMHEINSIQQEISTAVKHEDLKSAREAFARLGQVIASVDSSLLDEHPKMIWKELGMLLTNDSVEGSSVHDVHEAQRVLASLTQNLARLDKQFGLTHAGHVPDKLQAPPEFQTQLRQLWDAYVKIASALAADDEKAARAGVQALAKALKSVDMKLLTDNQAHMAWMQAAKELNSVGRSLQAAEDIRGLRAQFAPLSGVMQRLAMSFGFGSDQPVYRLHCPMAFNNKGASWLQQDDDTRNPYFGSTMLKCADQTELIVPGNSSPDTQEK